MAVNAERGSDGVGRDRDREERVRVLPVVKGGVFD